MSPKPTVVIIVNCNGKRRMVGSGSHRSTRPTAVRIGDCTTDSRLLGRVTHQGQDHIGGSGG
eukprot:3127222-Rhodomonas_salina.1